jgi:hypothetical protein
MADHELAEQEGALLPAREMMSVITTDGGDSLTTLDGAFDKAPPTLESTEPVPSPDVQQAE